MYPFIAPENFDNSRISSITNEQLVIKISDLLKQKEISKYISSKDKFLSLIKTYCEFFKLSEDKETIEYILPDNMTVFNILNIEKETVICMQNSLRDLFLEESKVKYDLINKNQILRNMKEQIEKNLYQKDTKNLGISGNVKNKNNFTRGKISEIDNDAFSWRRGSSDVKNSFDIHDKQSFKKKNYYNNNYKGGYQKKRNRYNSDVSGQNYYNNVHNNNNYYNNNNNNYHKNSVHNNNNSNNKDIEIDISNLKYPILIKNKYRFNDVKSFYEKICKDKLYPKMPEFLSNICSDIICNSPKNLIALDELIESENLLNIEKEQEKNNENVKIPKVNPLSNIGKRLNDEKNIPSTVEENVKEE